MTLPIRSIRTAVLLLAAAQLLALAAGQRARNCRTLILRLPGTTNKNYSLVCRCGPLGSPRFRARAVQRIPPFVRDTKAQADATVHCLQRRLRHLSHRCARSARGFEHAAAHALRRCVLHVRPRRDNGKPFAFDRSNCRSEFRSLNARLVASGREILETLLVCTCPQAPGYAVNPGVVQLVTAGSPAQAEREAAFVAQCTKQEVGRLGDSCGGSATGRFDLRAAQALNVCCKRARTRAPLRKLDCQAVVPSDVSKIKLLI